MRLWLLACLTVLVVCAVVLTVRTTATRDEEPTKQEQQNDNCLVDRAVAKGMGGTVPRECR